MKKRAQNSKTATKTGGYSPSAVMAAVKAVVGEEQDPFNDVDDHPGSLDLLTRNHKITKLLAHCERLLQKIS